MVDQREHRQGLQSSSEPAGSRRSRLRTVAVLATGAFVTALNVTMLSPLLPAIGTNFKVSDAAAGQLVTATAATSAITALVAAPWMDRWSRRVWFRVECWLLLAGALLSAVAPGFGWLVAARILAGAGGAIIFANCMVAAADLYPDSQQRNRVIGVLSTAVTLGAVIGLPMIAQLDAWLGWRWAIAATAPFTVIVLIGSGSLPGGTASANGPLFRGWWSGYRRVLANRETVWLLGAVIAVMAIWFGWIVYFGDFTKHVHRIGANGLSGLFLIAGVTQMAASNAVPVLLRRWGPRRTGAVATIAAAVDLLAVGIVWTSSWLLVPFVVIISAALITAFLCTSILLLDSFPEGRGSVMSLQSAGLEGGGALGAAGFGVALTLLGGYEASYRLLGVAAPITLVFLFVSARRALTAREPAAAESAVPSVTRSE